MGIINIVYAKSGGMIRSLRELAYFLKRNVNIEEFTGKISLLGLIPVKEVSVKGALYSSCITVLEEILDLTKEEAIEALNVLEKAGFIRITNPILVTEYIDKSYRNVVGYDKLVLFQI